MRILTIALLLASVAACRRGQPSPADTAPSAKVEIETHVMGTSVRFVAYTRHAVGEPAVRSAIAAAIAELHLVDDRMSTWRPDTEVSQVNAQAGERVRVSEETFLVLEKSKWAGSISSGVFDITFETMGDLWRFGGAAESHPTPPAPEAVEERRHLLGYANVELDPKTREVRIPKGRKIGLGGIAKGYAVDRAVSALRRAGVETFLVQAGGDLYAAGKKPDGQPWTMGLQDPRGPRGSVFGTLDFTDRGLSTAGDYERFYIYNGKRYHHIIDPRTGYPATASRAVSVLAPDSLTADAVDDCVFILGHELGLALVESLPGVGAIVVDADNKVWVSERLRGRVHLTRDPTP